MLAFDLFSGAGGLSHGLERAGVHVVLGADHDAEALETHRHHFAGMAVDWDLGDVDVVERIAGLMRDNEIDILAGGPPCQPFSKAGRSLMRHLVRTGARDPHDRRRDLWRSYLEVIRLALPQAVIMENVPDMALDREMFILRSMVLELEQVGYQVHTKVVQAWRYGVPQFRQRLILVALREGGPFEWPAEVPRKVTVENAISDLPRVAGGWRPEGGAQGWAEYEGPRTSFQRLMREGVRGEDKGKVFDQITRPVREDDERAFELLDEDTLYSDLPDELKRYRDDIFNDKYKRLSGRDVSRTITAHIAKDGYWYIHPEQNRTITVREAARLQTFPDWYRFAGPPSAAFKQIGNAVPPRLGEAIGSAVLEALAANPPAQPRPTSEELGERLADWFDTKSQCGAPWFHSGSEWSVLLAEMLMDRLSPILTASAWPILAQFDTPARVLADRARMVEILRIMGRQRRATHVWEVAEALSGAAQELPERVLNRLVKQGHLRQASVDLAMLASEGGEEPVVVTSGALRVANRFSDNAMGRKNQRSDGRIAIARMIGFGPRARQAQLALLELGATVCTPAKPACDACPLAADCSSRRRLVEDAQSDVQ